MIRSLPFTPTLAFPAAAAPRREAVRTPDLGDNASEDPFNRALTRQRDAARLAAKTQGSQAPAPVQPPMQAPTPESAAASGAKDAANKEAASTAAPGAPGAAVRTANRTALRGDEKDRPAQLDPEPPAPGDARHGRKNAGSEADVLARLFKTAPQGLPPKLSPLDPEDPGTAAGGTASENAPGAPGAPGTPATFQPQPPLVECPVDPNCQLQSVAKEAMQGQDSTQALQDRAAAAAATATATATAAVDGAAGLKEEAAQAPATEFAAALVADTGAPPDSAQGSSASPSLQATSLASAAGSISAAPAGAAPRSADLEPRPGSEAFAMKFSAQVAVWVREGVHEAQLQLNPAEMGPVRVAILLDGAAAQVNFTAEHALTRQALEQALPTLAGSLAEAGFTLAGGGVFDQPQHSERSDRSATDEVRRAAGNGQTGAGDEARNATPAAVNSPRGMVDLVA